MNEEIYPCHMCDFTTERLFNYLVHIRENHNKPTEHEIAKYDLELYNVVWIPQMLKDVGVLKSTSEGIRMINDGAIEMDGNKITSQYLFIKKNRFVNG